jgi:hypothetical protein
LFVCLSLCLFVCLFVCFFVCLFFCFTCQTLSVCSSVMLWFVGKVDKNCISSLSVHLFFYLCFLLSWVICYVCVLFSVCSVVFCCLSSCGMLCNGRDNDYMSSLSVHLFSDLCLVSLVIGKVDNNCISSLFVVLSVLWHSL